MNGPTKLNEGKVYHVGDKLTIACSMRVFGNIASSNGAGFSLILPIKIGSDVNSFTLENAAANTSLITYSGSRVVSHAIENGTSYYTIGTIGDRDLGIMSFTYFYPTTSTGSQVMAFLALPPTNPTVITFGA